MGVDYYSCDGCNFGFRDDSEYACYCECGCKFCNIECGKLHNYGEYDNDRETHRINDDQEISCNICRKEIANTYVLFQALLKHFNLTYEQAFEIYKDQK